MRSDQSFEDYRESMLDYLWSEIEPHAEEWDETGDLPREELWDEWQEMGFLGAMAPEEYGGLDLTQREYVELEKEWAKVSGGLRVILHVHNTNVELLDHVGTEAQKDRWMPEIVDEGASFAFALTEPHAGSGTDIETHAEKDDDEYVLNGEKHHITNADFTEYFNVITRTENGFSILVVPRDADGFTIREMPETMGSHGSEHCYLHFDDVRVPEENLLGREEGSGVRDAVDHLRVSRIYIGANALGISERCLEEAVNWAKMRVTFGKPIAERQAVQQYLGEMARDVYALRLAVEDAARQVDEKGRAGIEADLCKLMAKDVTQRVTDNAMLVFGGLGYYREVPVQRFYRDARLNWLEEGTPSIQQITAAKNLLNGEYPYELDEQAVDHLDNPVDEYDSDGGNEYELSYEL
ncbi:acyl-CoA dehydrogenase family protein [Natronorubrum tibetense]|uniref:acyl-CoA dehydrogenase family protein n=2 Tax=Natronorubrum tibetense TaxID=63128 RepID=UPI000382A464|nr:acyl-CoA dehydrogenase family protein [Natronorubrum tibetense]